jgi:predicted O-linked N-acetylglucosamine transferase (SPINDLY family)
MSEFARALHDRCWRISASATTATLFLAAFDHCRIIRTLSDEQAAQVIHDDETDVLVDLNGITDGSRLPVLRWRPAPIQATCLGFLGSIPMPEPDYLLCDKMVIPPEYESAYRPVPLPILHIYTEWQGQSIQWRFGSVPEAVCTMPKFFNLATHTPG